MIIFLYGKDTYRSREELRKIIEEYKKANPNWLDFVRVDASNEEIDIFTQFRQSANTVSMFNEKKLIVIENIFSASQETQQRILDFLKKKNIEKDKDITVVFWTEETESQSRLFKFFEKSAKVQEFNLLQPYKLREWVKQYIREKRGDIEIRAVERLINYVGNDLWRMANELDKLLNYRSIIKVEDVELLVRPEIDLNIFEMVDALGYKNKSRALKLFNQHLKKGENESYLFSMFIYQIRNLLKFKSAPSTKLEMHPFVIKKTSQQAKNFSFEDLKKIYQKLLEIDLDIKTGKIDTKTALEMFIVNL